MENEIPNQQPEEGWWLWRARQKAKNNPEAERVLKGIIANAIIENLLQLAGAAAVVGAEIVYLYFISHSDGFAYILPVATGSVFGIYKTYSMLRGGKMRGPKE